MAHYPNVPWPAHLLLMVAPYDAELHSPGSKGRQGVCLWGDHDAEAKWSAVWSGERWAVCDEHLPALAKAELLRGQEKPEPDRSLSERFEEYLRGDITALKRKGYNPTLFLDMVRKRGAVGAAKRLLADPRHTSYGFQKLWEMGELERSVEFAVNLPWFAALFSDAELAEAERRLVLHDFPLADRLRAREAAPPDWWDR